jgi:hypothetical protein
MVDAGKSSAPGRELACLGRGDVPAAMLDASVPVRRRLGHGRSRSRTHDFVASTI